jgi:hypothetical protein
MLLRKYLYLVIRFWIFTDQLESVKFSLSIGNVYLHEKYILLYNKYILCLIRNTKNQWYCQFKITNVTSRKFIYHPIVCIFVQNTNTLNKMDTKQKNKILYAMVGLWTETFCRIICDTADFKLQYMVISVLHNMKKIESSHIRIKTQG